MSNVVILDVGRGSSLTGAKGRVRVSPASVGKKIKSKKMEEKKSQTPPFQNLKIQAYIPLNYCWG